DLHVDQETGTAALDNRDPGEQVQLPPPAARGEELLVEKSRTGRSRRLASSGATRRRRSAKKLRSSSLKIESCRGISLPQESRGDRLFLRETENGRSILQENRGKDSYRRPRSIRCALRTSGIAWR